METIELNPNPNFRSQGSQQSGSKKMMPKRWKAARYIQNGRDKDINLIVEIYYKQMLTYAKKLIAQLPDLYQRTVFEKDYREDNTENSLTMHTFIAPCLFWELECNFAYHYMANYDFHNCPFEKEFREEIARRCRLMRYSLQTPQKPNCEEFLKRVFKVQDEEYTFLLKAEDF